jgi:chaperonin cofactor prefoldin
MQLEGIEAIVMSAIFICAITVVPLSVISPNLKDRVNEKLYCRWINRKAPEESNAITGIAIIIFIAFATVFLVMSVSNPERFVAGQGSDRITNMFSGVLADVGTVITEMSSENAVLAAWVIGFLPCFTTLISLTIYLSVMIDKKEERIWREIQNCINKIKQTKKEADALSINIENAEAELVSLDKVIDCVNELQHNTDEFASNKTIYMQQIKDEQRQEFNEAQKSVETKIRTDMNYLYKFGITKLAPIQQGNKARHKELKQTWKDFYQEMRVKIATEMSKTWGPGQSYAAMVIVPPQQKFSKRGA